MQQNVLVIIMVAQSFPELGKLSFQNDLTHVFIYIMQCNYWQWKDLSQWEITGEGTAGNIHAMPLFPKALFTCPASKSSCCNIILEAKMSIGMEDKSSLHKVNLTMLHKNIRSKKDKTSGQKERVCRLLWYHSCSRFIEEYND